jgi:hypothetical protein
MKNQAAAARLIDTFRAACRPDTEPPAPPKDEVAAWMRRLFCAAMKRHEAEAELVRELSAFTVPDEI